MTAAGRVLLALRSSMAPAASIDAGCAFARALGLPVSALYIDEMAALPAVNSQADARIMAAATALGGQRAQATFTVAAARAGLVASFATGRGAAADVLGAAAEAHDIVLAPLDFATDRFGDVLARALTLGACASGVALVPVVHPARQGTVSALIEPDDRQTVVFAVRLAQGLGAPLLVTLAGGTRSDADALRETLRRQHGVVAELRHLTSPTHEATMLLPEGSRVAITTPQGVSRLDPTAIQTLLRRGRATLLLRGAARGDGKLKTSEEK